MEMLPPAPVPSNVVVGVTIVKRFPGYGVHRGTIAELDIDGGKVLVHWSTTDERTTLSLTEAAKRVVASPLADEEDDDQSVRHRRAGPVARSDGDYVQVLGRVLEQGRATVDGAIQGRER